MSETSAPGVEYLRQRASSFMLVAWASFALTRPRYGWLSCYICPLSPAFRSAEERPNPTNERGVSTHTHTAQEESTTTSEQRDRRGRRHVGKRVRGSASAKTLTTPIREPNAGGTSVQNAPEEPLVRQPAGKMTSPVALMAVNEPRN